MPCTKFRPSITRLSPRGTGADLEIRCGRCDGTFSSQQYLVCGVPMGKHHCPHCGEDQVIAPELYEAALHQFCPPNNSGTTGFPDLRFAAAAPLEVLPKDRTVCSPLTILYAPAHPMTHGELHGDLARRSIALQRRLMVMAEAVGDSVQVHLRPDPEERVNRTGLVDESALRESFCQWALDSGVKAPRFVSGAIEEVLSGTDLLITHVGAPWIDSALKAGIEVMVLPFLPGSQGERIAAGALLLRDSQLSDAVMHWVEGQKGTPQEPSLPEVVISDRDPNVLRVLFAYREDVDNDGGAAVVMNETRKALERRGCQVDVTYDLRPDTSSYDLVHCFNLWNPETSLKQIDHIHQSRTPIVWSPIYLDLCELLWAGPFLMSIQRLPLDQRQDLWQKYESGFGQLGDFSRYAANEVFPGHFDRVADALKKVDHVCVTSQHEVATIYRQTKSMSFPFSVVPHGVQAKPFREATKDLFIKVFGLRDFVLCVGALDRRKNQLMVVEALRDQDLDIVFIGPAFESDYLETLQNTASSRVRFLGKQPQAIVASAMKAAAVHVLASFSEGAALANLEAAVAGCPMVVSNRSSEFEYFADAPYYCDPSDRVSIREAILRAISEKDMRERARLILAQRVEAICDWDRAAELTESIYASLKLAHAR